MKSIGVACLLVVGMVLSACGGGSSGGNINGNWTATLTNTDGTTAFAFTTTIMQGMGNNLTITNFAFTTSGSCFESQPVTETGSFGFTGNFNGKVSGTFGMTVSTAGSIQDVLTLNGTVSNGRITGTWTLTGSAACTGNGSFTMTKT